MVPCYHPLKAFRADNGSVVFNQAHEDGKTIWLPCGQCIGCRMRRASDWELRIMHEAQSHERACFVTLTYAPGRLPTNGSLEHRDFQLFMKRLIMRERRAHLAAGGLPWEMPTVRFYMCGEYGPLKQRPHYHAVLFGVDFRDDRSNAGKSPSGYVFFESAALTALWGHGKATVQDLKRETAGYCARYIMKKALGVAAETAYERVDDDGVICRVEPEYASMSKKPGIGAAWFEKFGGDVFPHDFVIANGSERVVPRYYDRLLEREDEFMYADMKTARETRAHEWEAYLESLPERLEVREVVHAARVSTLKRGLE